MSFATLARALRRWRRALFESKEGSGPRYDRETGEVIRRLLRPDSIAVDVGAHEGDILDQMVRAAPRARHHAFEPLPHLAANLRRRFPEVVVHAVALSDRAGRSPFVHVLNDPGYSGLRPRVYDHPQPRLETIEVETTTLDAVLPSDAAIAFIKLDIEGGEYDALRGAERTLRRWRPALVFEAGEKSSGAYGVAPDRMFELLHDELDYDVTTMRRWLDGGPPYTRDSFHHNWVYGKDYYFMAIPRTDAAARAPDRRDL